MSIISSITFYIAMNKQRRAEQVYIGESEEGV